MAMAMDGVANVAVTSDGSTTDASAQPILSVRDSGRQRTALVLDVGGILDDSLEDLPPMLPVYSRTAMVLPEATPEGLEKDNDSSIPAPPRNSRTAILPLPSKDRTGSANLSVDTTPGSGRKRTAMLPLIDFPNNQLPVSRTATLPLSRSPSSRRASPCSADAIEDTDSMRMVVFRTPTLLSRMSQQIQATLRAGKIN